MHLSRSDPDPTNTAPPAPSLSLAIQAPTLVNRGERFNISVTVANSGSDASAVSATLAWVPTNRLETRGSNTTQAIGAVPGGGSGVASWTLRARRAGATTLVVTVTDGAGNAAQITASLTVAD